MAVKLRLMRMGRKKRPFYRVIAIDSRSPRDGKYLEKLGTYNPLTEPLEVSINEERALYWLGVGAIPSDTVKSLLRREGILYKWDLIRKKLSEEELDEKMKLWDVIKLERQKKLQAKLEEKKSQATKKSEEQKAKIEEQEKKEEKKAEAKETVAAVDAQVDAEVAEKTVEEKVVPEDVNDEVEAVVEEKPAVEDVKAQTPEPKSENESESPEEVR
ncbi:30S ribosomal protein S16 [candidate division KSB1 bacterium]|nr:30S ribosomal protein S16 [candidate division KSB1 bacterium]